MLKDRLHIVAMIITSMGTMLQFIGVLLPNWWVLKQHGTVITAFSLFGNIRCSDRVCYPEDLSIVPIPEGKDPPRGITGDNAAWLVTGRVFCVLGSFLIIVALILQLAFLKWTARSLQILASGFLILAGLVDFINGFLFIGIFSTLTRVYTEERPLGALTYTPAVAGCILFASLACVVAALFTVLAFRPPVKDPRFA